MGNLLQERLSARTIIFDGAMGTELYKRNFFVNLEINSPICRIFYENVGEGG